MCPSRRSTRPSKSESNVKYPAVKVAVRKVILAEAADSVLQFDLTAPEHTETKERRFPVEIFGGDPSLGPDAVIWSRSTTWCPVHPHAPLMVSCPLMA